MAPVRNRSRHRSSSSRPHSQSIETVDITSSVGSVRRRSSNAATVKKWEGNSFEFETRVPSEVKTITWKVKDFSSLIQLKGVEGKHQIKFNAGESIDMNSRWRFELLMGPDAENKIGLFLSLVKYDGQATKIFAKFDAKIAYPCGTKDLVNRKVDPVDLKAVLDWGWSNFVSASQLKTAGALADDTLIIEIKFIVYGKSVRHSFELPAQSLEKNSRDMILANMGTLLESGINSDFIIKVPRPNSDKYETVKVHKAVLCAQSQVFQAMLDVEMSERNSGELVIEDLSPKSLNVLLKFMYTGNVSDEWKLVPEEIVNAAEKYDLHFLKEFCDKNFHYACNLDNAFKLLKMAKIHGLNSAVMNIKEFIKSHVSAITNNV